jgi:tetratricopeptide (TPR) repeat protein
MDARWHVLCGWMLVALMPQTVAAQEPVAETGGAAPPMSASEILAAAAEEAAKAKYQQPADPPSPPEDFVPPRTAQPRPLSPPPREFAAEPIVNEDAQLMPAEFAAPLPEELPNGEIAQPLSAAPDASDAAAPADFLGIHPGRTTRNELHQLWGEPEQVDRIPGGVRESYPSDAFDQLRVTVLEDVVQSISLKMRDSLSVDKAAERLRVADVEAVEMIDDSGRLVGYAYPEKGMLLELDEQLSRPRVARIVIEQVSAPPFLARAEKRMDSHFAACLDDVARVLGIEPDCGRAYWIEARVLARTGEFERAVKSLHKAIELEPEEMEYRLTMAEVLVVTGDHRGAIQQTRDVIDSQLAEPVTLALAHCRWGDCVAAAPERDFKQATEHHLQAIKLAEPLAKSADVLSRRAAKEVLVDAYLGVAYDVGHGHWQQQATVVPQWLDQALATADDAIRRDRAAAELRLHVYERALAALAGVVEPPDPHKWSRGLGELGAVLVRQADDPDYQSHLSWRMAVALGDATEIETARQNGQEAMRLGNMSMAYFAKGEAIGSNFPNYDYLRGWLCYRMGAIHAIERGDHKQAMAWFEQAVPLLESPTPASSTVSKARHGETFVSMAISCWEVNQHEEAVRLTRQGLDLMEQAANDGQLDKSALAVPYSNLARMHELMGDKRSAQQYTELAERVRALAPQ